MQVVGITGGCGFVGRRLAAALLDDQGLSISLVVLLDYAAPSPPTIPFAKSTIAARSQHHTIEPFDATATTAADSTDSSSPTARLQYIHVDLTDRAAVMRVLQSVRFDTIYHLASYGMSGREQLQYSRIHKVNINATSYLLEACRAYAIPRLIYMSTYNTVFTRHPIVNGSEENASYPPSLNDFHDEYSKTKRIAEEMVLKANSDTLSTCAIRPAAIYGDGEMRHLPRILSHVKLGLGLFAIGSKSTLCDWVYCDNLTHACILAGQSLTMNAATHDDDTSDDTFASFTSSLHHNRSHNTPHSRRSPLLKSPASGRAYCISDDTPMNNFEFLRLLCNGLGYENVFKYYIPANFMFYMAWLLEMLRFLLIIVSCGCLSFQPFLTRAEVMKVGVTHYFSMKQAKKDLGYTPIVSVSTAVERCVEYYAEEYATATVKKRRRREEVEKALESQTNHERM